MTTAFELGGELIKPEVAKNLMRLIAEGSGGDDDDLDLSTRIEVVESFLALTEKPQLPNILLQVVCWVMGEYGYVLGAERLPDVEQSICDLAARQQIDVETRGYAVTAALKLSAQCGACSPVAAALAEKYSRSMEATLQQRCFEFKELVKSPDAMRVVLPIDASCEDIEVEDGLPFLNAYVQAALGRGADAYDPPALSDDEDDDEGAGGDGNAGGLRFEAYDTPTAPSLQQVDMVQQGGGGMGDDGSTGGQQAGNGGLDVSNVKSVWGSTGFTGAGAGNRGGSSKPESNPSGGVITAADYSAPGQGFDAGLGGGDQSGFGDTGGFGDSTPANEPVEVFEEEDETPAERVLTDREREAAALFGGISATPAPARCVSCVVVCVALVSLALEGAYVRGVVGVLCEVGGML